MLEKEKVLENELKNKKRWKIRSKALKKKYLKLKSKKNQLRMKMMF